MATCLFLSWAYWKTKGVEVRYGRHSTSRTRGGPQGPPCEKFGWCEYALTGSVVRVCTSANRTRALAIPEPVDAASVFATSITKAMKSQRATGPRSAMITSSYPPNTNTRRCTRHPVPVSDITFNSMQGHMPYGVFLRGYKRGCFPS